MITTTLKVHTKIKRKVNVVHSLCGYHCVSCYSPSKPCSFHYASPRISAEKQNKTKSIQKVTAH